MQAHGFRFCFTPLTAVLFTFPSRYWFTIGRRRVFSLTRWSAQIHTTFHVCRVTQGHPRVRSDFGYGDFTLCVATFQKLHLSSRIPRRGPTTPRPMDGVWAVPLSLATTHGIDSLSFPPLTEMFHFSGSREPFPMDSGRDDPVLTGPGYPIRKSPDQSLFAAPRGLSQLTTSFVASRHLGIHHAPFIA